MTREQLIREMIQIELLYRTRQKMLAERRRLLLKEINNEDNFEFDDEEINNKLYSDEEEKTDEEEKSQEKVTDIPKIEEPKGTASSNNLLQNLFTNKDNKNISVEVVKHILNSETINNTKQHNNDLKKQVFEYYGNNKKLDNEQCLSIYSKIFDKRQDDKYLQGLIDFKFDNYSASQMDKLVSDLNSTYVKTINDTGFLKDLYVNTTSSGRGGVGKGEFLLLSFIKDAKSGGTKQHDLISGDAEYEVKQGKGDKEEAKEGAEKAASDFKFNTNIRIRTNTASMRDKLITDLNKFFTRFIASTKHMDQILNLSSQYESSFIFNNYISQADSKGGYVAKATYNEILNPLIRDENIEDDQFYEKKDGLYYPSAIFPALAGVINGEQPDKTYFKATDSDLTGSLTQNFQFGADLKSLKPIIDLISGRTKTGSGKKMTLDSDKNFSNETLKKIQGIYLKFNKTSADKYHDFVEIINTNNNNPDNPLNSKNKIKKDPSKYRVVNALTFLKRLKELSDKENPIKNNQIITYISSTSLKTWFDTYFVPVLFEYQNALVFYKNMLTQILNAAANSQDIKYDLMQALEKNQEKSQDNYLKYKKIGSEENLRQLLNYKIFLDFYKGLSFNDEVVIDIKYYDSNNQLKKRKQIINTINDEFQVLKPDDSNVDVNDFFSSAKEDETFDLRIKNENISEAQFEDIMNAKEIFAFLNDNLNTKTTDSENSAMKPSATLTTTVNREDASKNMLSLLDNIITSFLKLHDAVYQEYSNPSDKQNSNKKGGLLYITEKNKTDDISSFTLLFGPKNNKNESVYDNDNFKSLDKFESFISQNPLPLIKDVNANNTLLWASYSKDSEYVLTVLLKLRNELLLRMGDIQTHVEEIKGLIKNLLAKNPGKKMRSIINPNT